MKAAMTTGERTTDRPDQRRRADEALVASYIHELSARHRAKAESRRAEPVPEPAPC